MGARSSDPQRAERRLRLHSYKSPPAILHATATLPSRNLAGVVRSQLASCKWQASNAATQNAGLRLLQERARIASKQVYPARFQNMSIALVLGHAGAAGCTCSSKTPGRQLALP